MVTAGDAHTCGLTVQGEAWCWGAGGEGQLGNGDTASHLLPVRVRGGFRFATLAAGARHTCGLTLVGQLLCWGLNDHGQLGIGTTVPHCYRAIYGEDEDQYFEPIPCAVDPQLVPEAPPFVAIAAGFGTCGLTAAGDVNCFGFSAGMVALLRGLRIARMAPDGTCGLREDGVAHCWAKPFDFDGPVVLTEPMAVANGSVFRSITANGAHQCGIAKATQTALCWGRNDNGQLGNGTIAPSASPLPVARPENP
jgi:hypothetical protein